MSTLVQRLTAERGPLSEAELTEVRAWMRNREGRPASAGMIVAVRLLETLDAEVADRDLGPIAPDLTPEGIERAADLAERMDRLPVMDVLRVFSTAAHSLWHRDPERSTHEALVAELREAIDALHAAGLP